MASLEPVMRIPAFQRAKFRRTIIIGVIVGAVGLVSLVMTGHPLMGLFGCLGILLGAVNGLLVQRSVLNYGAQAAANKRATLATSIAGRLVLITALALVFGIVFAPNGIAVFAGLAIFQFILLASTALPAMRRMRQS